jgi:hypothetical protein
MLGEDRLMILIEDTARNTLPAWTIEAMHASPVTGVVLSPFMTPRSGAHFHQSAKPLVDRLQAEGLTVWVDPETHALQMPAVGDFRYYDAWSFWSGASGDLRTLADIQDHLERVFAAQDALGVPHLAPTILLHSAQSQSSLLALEMAQAANDLDPDARLAIAGDPAFWASGNALDAHVGAFAQLAPPSWSLTVARQFTDLPVRCVAEEVHGICRTTRALSEDAEVHVSHGDLTALPAIAAGAHTLGTGWDSRQRVCAYTSYEARTTGTSGGGQWFQQVTLQGLLSLLRNSEAETLYQQDQQLASALLPGTVPPGPKEAFLHHVAVLGDVVSDLLPADYRSAYRDLTARYERAAAEWPNVAAVIGVASRSNGWLAALADGLGRYGATEGY